MGDEAMRRFMKGDGDNYWDHPNGRQVEHIRQAAVLRARLPHLLRSEATGSRRGRCLCSITSAVLASSERPSARRKPGLSSSPAQLVCEVNQILRDHIKPTQPSFAGLLEIPQIGRRLILLGGHQKSVRAQVVVSLPMTIWTLPSTQ